MSVTIAGNSNVVLQVVSQVFASTPSTSSTSWVDSGVQLSITPSSASNKIIVIMSGTVGTTSGAPMVSFGRGGTTNVTGAYMRFTADYNWPDNNYCFCLQAIDSPATTSSVTYNILLSNATGAGSTFLNRSGSNNGNSATTITLMEIAG